MRYQIDLLPQRLIELRNTMPQCVHPQGRESVQITPPINIDQLAAFTAFDDHGCVIGIAGHLRKAMPHDCAVALDPVHIIIRASI
jgi:hypothetical protein